MEVVLTQQCFEINQETGRVKVKREPGPEGGRPHEGTWAIGGPLELTKADPSLDPASLAFLASSRRCGQASWAQPAEKTL